MIKLNLNPTVADLRRFGFIALGVFGLLGALINWQLIPLARLLGAYAPTAAYGLWAVGALSAALSLVAPRANRPLFVGLSVAGYPIGLALSYIIMGAVFFLVLAPFGFLRRRLARGDVLTRQFDRSAPSYWVDHQPARDSTRYFSQY